MPTSPNPLPTAWLVPPPSLLASNHSIKIIPALLAISATLASLVILLVTILLARKHKDIFLGDGIADTAPSTPIYSANPARLQISSPVLVRGPQIPRLAPARPRTHLAPPRAHTRLAPPRGRTQPPDWQPTFYQGRKVNAMFGWQGDDATLADSDRNSAYVPYPHSDVSEGVGSMLRVSGSWMSDVVRGSPMSFDERERDAY